MKLAAVTIRPTATLVAQAVEASFDDIGPSKAYSFATMVQRSVSAARGRMRSVSTGKRRPEAVRKLVLALRTTRIHPSLKRSLKARIPESSVEPAPLLLARKTLDNNTRSHSREDILRLYGVGVNSRVPVVDLPVRLDADEDEPAETKATNTCRWRS